MNDNKQGCVAIVIGILLFVLCPIVLLLYGLSATPLGLKIGLMVWLIFSVSCFTFFKEKSGKWGLSLFGTFIYAIIFVSWFVEDELDGYFGNGGLGDAIGMFMMPFATLVPLYFLGSWLQSVIDNKKASDISARKESLVKALGEMINQKQIILQVINKYFAKIEKQFSLISLISSCAGNNNQELKNLLISSKEEAFTSTKKEIFNELSDDEKKRFPENVSAVVDYKRMLEQEISELKTDLSFVASSDKKKLSQLLEKHRSALSKNKI